MVIELGFFAVAQCYCNVRNFVAYFQCTCEYCITERLVVWVFVKFCRDTLYHLFGIGITQVWQNSVFHLEWCHWRCIVVDKEAYSLCLCFNALCSGDSFHLQLAFFACSPLLAVLLLKSFNLFCNFHGCSTVNFLICTV